MISESTINRVRDNVDIVDVVGKYVKLTKNKGKCPFHNERSASFSVSHSKQIYKCFGCGKGGDVISFMRDIENIDFAQAIERLARDYGIAIEYEQWTDDQKKRYEQRVTLSQTTEAAKNAFVKALQETPSALEYLTTRGLDKETVAVFGIGYAPDTWQYLTRILIDSNQYDQGIALGLLHTKDGRTHDHFANRIIFPSFDMMGRVTGFGGRVMDDSKPKYINSTENELYNKSETLYGLTQAAKAIGEFDSAYLVEGNFDVLTMYQGGFRNTVAGAGTSLTEGHVKILKRYTKRVTMMYDGDKAGVAAMLKYVDLLVRFDLQVKVIELPARTNDEGEVENDEKGNPIMMDPDEYVRKFKPSREDLDDKAVDGIEWKAQKLLAGVTDTHIRAEGTDKLTTLIALIPNALKRDDYTKRFCKKYNVNASTFRDMINGKIPAMEATEGDPTKPVKLPDGVTAEDYFKTGFYERTQPGEAGYYFKGEFGFRRISNFVLRPLFHVYDDKDEDNRRLIEINNGYQKKILEVQSRSLGSLEYFKGLMLNKGNFLFEGDAKQLLRILSKVLPHFPLCYELKTLGWQKEGFFAFSNAIFNGTLKKLDDYGIVQHNERNFFSPSESSLTMDNRNDDYANDRYIRLRPSPIKFSEWTSLMHDVYPDKAELGIGFVFIGLFKDVVFKIDNNSPHLFCYGQTQSGKTKFAASLANVFTHDMPPFNLNHGTVAAFNSLLGRFSNCVIQLEEYDDNAIAEERFQTLKSAFDGTGRQRQSRGGRNKSETQQVSGSPVITGQYLGTRDDNAMLNRCLVLSFQPKEARTVAEVEKYNRLKEYEKQGLNGMLTELLPYRKQLEAEYPELFATAFRELRNNLLQMRINPIERVLRNYAAVYAMYKFFEGKVELPYSAKHIFGYCAAHVTNLSRLVSDSNMLSDFWRSVEFLLETQKIVDGFHFDVKTVTEIMTEERGKVSFGKPTRVLMLRLGTIHNLYSTEFKQRTGRPAFDQSTLKLYMKSKPYFIGTNQSSRFSGTMRDAAGSVKEMSTVSSSIVFDYDLLGVDLDRSSEGNERKEKLAAGEQELPVEEAIKQGFEQKEDLPF